jgi:hypothetical protein
MPTPRKFRPTRRSARLALALLLASAAGLVSLQSSAQRVSLTAAAPAAPAALAGLVDSGSLPAAASLHLTIDLAPTPDRAAALDAFLDQVQRSTAPGFHRYLTPGQFAAAFGATNAQIAAASTWLAAQGLSVEGISAGGTHLAVSGSVDHIQNAFAVSLHQFTGGSSVYFANTTAASLPSDFAPLIAAVYGLDDLAADTGTTVTGFNPAGASVPLIAAAPLAALAAAIDANDLPIVTLTSPACTSAGSDLDAYRTLFRQANAQGITILASSGCPAGGLPASLAEVTSIVSPSAAAIAASVTTRPGWQTAPGLPAATTRAEPDLTASLPALAATLAAIVQQSGSRQGNIGPTLYLLAAEPGLFTQPDSAAAGTWEPASGLGAVDLTALAKAWPRGTTAPLISLTFSAYSPTHGQTVTITSNVSSTTGGVAPSGTVTFASGQAGTLATVSLVNGTATTTTNQLAGGQYAFTATYSGDSTYAGIVSNVNTVTILPEPVIVTASAVSGSTFGGNVTVNVTVSSTSGVGTPTGTVTVAPQNSSASTTNNLTSTGIANAPGTASVTVPVPQGGPYNLNVTCAGDASFSCNNASSNLPVTSAPAATTTTLTLTPSAPTVGSYFQIVATVSHVGNLLATGSIQFFDGASLLNTTSLGGGTASMTVILSTGAHNYTAVYKGDPNYTGSTSTATAAAGGTVTTTTSLSSSIYGVTYGQPFNLSSNVQPTNTVNNAVPTGSVTFTAASQGTLGTVALTNGSANLASLGSLPVGTYVLTAAYSGDTNFAASSSTSNTVLTISQAQGILTANLAPSTVGTGASAALTINLALPYSGAGSPAGNVTATVNGVPGAVYTAALTPVAGTATATALIQIPAPPAGTYTVQVGCSGTANYQCPTPATAQLTSTSTSSGNTTTTLVANPAIPLAGQSVTLTATIASPVAGTPTGAVTFLDNGVAIGSAPVAGRQASIVVNLPSGAGQSLTASYSGDTTFNPSVSPAVLVNISLVPSTIGLTASATSALYGANILITATVAGGAPPTGLVSFYDTYNSVSTLLGTGKLATSGPAQSAAQIATSGLFSGAHAIVAVYLGDTASSPATSTALAIGISDYTLTASPATLALTRGQIGTTNLAVNSVGGFTGRVTFSCIVPASSETTCTIFPLSINGAGTVGVTIGSAATHAKVDPSPLKSWLPSGLALAALVWLGLPRRRRSFGSLLVLLLGASLISAVGCGGGTSSTADPGSPAGTLLFTIDTAGTNGVTTVTHDIPYQVTLN